MSKEQPTKQDIIDDITRDSLARDFIEYPKMLHKTDGTNITVNSKAEEEAALRAGDVHPSPQAALDEKAKRDEAERQRVALAIAQEANAKALAEAGGEKGGKSK